MCAEEAERSECGCGCGCGGPAAGLSRVGLGGLNPMKANVLAMRQMIAAQVRKKADVSRQSHFTRRVVQNLTLNGYKRSPTS